MKNKKAFAFESANGSTSVATVSETEQGAKFRALRRLGIPVSAQDAPDCINDMFDAMAKVMGGRAVPAAVLETIKSKRGIKK